MTRTLAAAIIVFSLAAPLSAHRLDEYLQATLFSVEKDRVHAFLRLIPGVAVSNLVISSIDTNGDGVFSESERQAYAQRVLGDLSLRIDDRPLQLRLESAEFPATQEMRDGVGEIRIQYDADLPRGRQHRRLALDDRHQSRISVYLVNVLVSGDKNIQIVSQDRNENQSRYQLNFVQADAGPDVPAPSWLFGVGVPLGTVGLLLFLRLGFAWRRVVA